MMKMMALIVLLLLTLMMTITKVSLHSGAVFVGKSDQVSSASCFAG